MIAHEFPEGGGETKICKWCGASFQHLIASGGNLSCVPRWEENGERPAPARRTFAIDDFGVIQARVLELRQEEEAALNRVTEDVKGMAV